MINQRALLSVIVPVYNVAPYLRQCLDSIVGQTYENLEILLIDDGSTDESGAICDEYGKKDERIHVVHQENQGASGARNTGTALAAGDYIAFVDSDDWLDIRMYETLMEVVETHGLDMARCAAYSSDGVHETVLAPQKGNAQKTFTQPEIFTRYFDEFLCKIVWNAVYARHLIEGVISPERCQAEDNYVSGRYLYRSRAMRIIDRPLYYYWQNPRSVTRTGNQRRLDICICTALLIRDLRGEGFDDQGVLRQLKQKLARELYHFVRDKNEAYVVKSIQDAMYRFLFAHLDMRRRLELFYIVKSRGIHIDKAVREDEVLKCIFTNKNPSPPRIRDKDNEYIHLAVCSDANVSRAMGVLLYSLLCHMSCP